MDEVVTSVKRVADIIGEIAAASVEQSTGIDQVNTAVTSMDEVTQQNAALVEEAAAAAESLLDQANALADAVSVFKLDGSAGSPTSHNAAFTASIARIRPIAGLATSPKAVPKMAALAKSSALADGDWDEF
jgi:methyl-accepting chemotaxis protein